MMANDPKPDAQFNETLKRMLATPPKQHDTGKVGKSQAEKQKPAKASADAFSKTKGGAPSA